MLLYSARGQQLRNCIPVGIHLNLTGAHDQESTNHSARFVEWKSTYVTKSFVSRCGHCGCGSRRYDCILLVFFRRWGRLTTRHLNRWGRLAVCSRASQTTSEVTTSWDKRLSFSFEIITLVTTCTLQTRVDSEVTRSKLTSNLLGSFGKEGGRMAPRHQISLCAWNSGSSKKKSIKLYEWIIPPERFTALWGRASTRTGTEAFPDVCDQPLTENLREIKKDILTGAFIQFFNSSLSFTSTRHLRFTQTVFITVKLDCGRDEAESP